MTVAPENLAGQHAHPRRLRLATAQEVAAMLRLPRTSVYEHAQARTLPGVVRIGRRVLFDLDKLEPWIRSGAQAAAEGGAA